MLGIRRLLPYLTLACAPLAVAGAFMMLGAGYVLDDWFFRSTAQFDGTLSVGGEHAGQRPAAVLLWAVVFDWWAGRPLPSLLLMAAANSLFAVCLALLLRRVLPERIAIAVALTWAVLPAHTSLEVWLSCINIAWSQAAAAVALVVGWRDDRRWWHLLATGALVLFSVLSYEATVVVMALAFLVLPWLRRGRPDWALVTVAGGSASAGLAWVLTHWFEGKDVASDVARIQDVFVANTGWAFFSPGAAAQIFAAAALVPLAWAVASVALPSLRPHSGPAGHLVLAGVGVMFAGTLPFALYVYEPLGAGDRTNGLSAVGGALFVVGAGWMLARRSRTLARALAMGALLGALVARGERLWLWHLAGSDADALLTAVVARFPMPPPGEIVVGPGPESRDKILAFLETSSVESAVRVKYGEPAVRVRMTQTLQDFQSAPERLRFDLRPISRLHD